jgi:hypothetical protein
MDFVFELHHQDPALYWSLLVALTLTCCLLIAHMVWSLRAAARAVPTRPRAGSSGEDHDFAAEARELAAREQHLEAAHRLLLATLRTLAQQRHIALLPEDGNRAVCRKLSTSALPVRVRERVTSLIVRTEQAWFSGAPAAELGRSLYREWVEAHAEVARMGAP